jgi:hypothetical protein
MTPHGKDCSVSGKSLHGDAFVPIAVGMRLGQTHQQMGGQAEEILFTFVGPEVAR